MTVRDLLLARSRDTEPGLLFEDRGWSWTEAFQDAVDLAALLRARLDGDRPLHVGALLDNVPQMVHLLMGAGLGEFVLVGLNPTRRGEGLLADVRKADCQLVVTDAAYADLLVGCEVPVLEMGAAYDEELAAYRGSQLIERDVRGDELMMLIFTSGTSGDPKACRITQEKVAHPGVLLSERFGLTPEDTCYLSMPLFHSNAVMAGWAVALAAGATVALARRFTASGFLVDVRRFGATYANYVGKPLTYVLATPESPDDADNPLRLVFGNEATERDIERFAARFDCTVIDSYSSTENAIVVQRVPEMPAGALGRPLPGVAVLHDDGSPTADAEFGDAGDLLNPDAAIGELVNTSGAGFFAGYYNDPGADADRMRGGMYWSGDLAYRDSDGFVYFAGRTADWLRVDGENLAAAPIERVLLRHPLVTQAAVYAVPAADGVGDAVAAALVVEPDFTLADLVSFVNQQGDLGTKSRPEFVRLLDSMPQTATNKPLKRQLRDEGVTPDTHVLPRVKDVRPPP